MNIFKVEDGMATGGYIYAVCGREASNLHCRHFVA